MTTVEVVHVLALAYAALAAATLAVVLHCDTEEDNEEEVVQISSAVNEILTEVQAVKRAQKRVASSESINDNGSVRKKKKKEYDYEGARHNIYRDYLGADPNYGSQFARIFRITLPIFHRIFDVVSEVDPFFTFRPNPVSKKGIYPEAKIMIALKQLAYGCAPTAFLDYFQMGESA